MKTIALVSETDVTLKRQHSIVSNIKEVFGDYVKINEYALSGLKNKSKLCEDVILTTRAFNVPQLPEFVDDCSKIILMSRTFTVSQISRIHLLPCNAKVLVVNEADDLTAETLALLYALGITHLDLVAHKKGVDYYPDILTAITPGEPQSVPASIKNIVDIGCRSIDGKTMTKLMEKLNLENDDIVRNLLKYLDDIIDTDGGIKQKYINLYAKNEQLDWLIQNSEEGFLITDFNFSISLCNRTAMQALDVEKIENNAKLKDIVNDNLFAFLTQNSFDEPQYVVIGENDVLVSRTTLANFGYVSNFCFTFNTSKRITTMKRQLGEQINISGFNARYTFNDIIGDAPSILKCKQLCKKIANDFTVLLITGESGTGKELFAQSIHNYSIRRNMPFVAINCAAIPENLLESELFGYEAGTFTGAIKGGKSGYFEKANGGTIFLDEIGDIPLNLQTKLLRVLQEKQISRIGGQNLIDLDIKIISATNKNLIQLIDKGSFREDLYYRISALQINIPSLKERKQDILTLFYKFSRAGLQELSENDKSILLNHTWRGNIRELENQANYYSIMGELNYSSLGLHSDIGTVKIGAISPYVNNAVLKQILLSIKQLCDLKGGAGRQSILECLFEQNISLPENRLKNILHHLTTEEYIISYNGRQGCTLSQKGLSLLLNSL